MIINSGQEPCSLLLILEPLQIQGSIMPKVIPEPVSLELLIGVVLTGPVTAAKLFVGSYKRV